MPSEQPASAPHRAAGLQASLFQCTELHPVNRSSLLLSCTPASGNLHCASCFYAFDDLRSRVCAELCPVGPPPGLPKHAVLKAPYVLMMAECPACKGKAISPRSRFLVCPDQVFFSHSFTEEHGSRSASWLSPMVLRWAQGFTFNSVSDVFMWVCFLAPVFFHSGA